MKKTFIITFIMSMMAASVVSANQFLPEINKIKPDLETVITNQGNSDSGPQYTVIDHNPALYHKQVAGGHTVEGWTKDNIVYTAVDGTVTKSYRINADLETVITNQGNSDSGPQYTVIDHNPNLYSKRVLGGHTVESWAKDDIVYTAVDGTVTKSYRINADLETVITNQGNSDSGPQYTVIDHNPNLYSKRVVGGHIVESWIKDDIVYTAVDGTIIKN
ncbi:hypothetical protein [Anaerospora hongkongensis]|uniref:hypothetical protein n=1 Tax=Anaerospora hongkongensis TaxID=244830 RepID=UPI00289CD440|nr:hypothetical protein [Anaerospora hongkongensis]